MLKVTLMDVVTGEVQVYPCTDISVWSWTEGNWGMDDNRAIAFPEIEKWIDENYPNEFYGCHLLIVIEAEGDLEGYSQQEFIQKANEGYPQNLTSEK